MGYNIEHISLAARLDNHLGPETARDRRAFERFEQEIWAMIDADPEYAQIFGWGMGHRISSQVPA
jgi:hypothetical protein